MAETKKETAKETVTVDKKTLDALMTRLENLEKGESKVSTDGKVAPKENPRWLEKEKIKLFKGPGEYSKDVFISVDGHRYQIQRGKEVEVPVPVAWALRYSEEQKQKVAEMLDQYQSDSKFN